VAGGSIGDVTFCHAFQSGAVKKEGYGNPPDGDPPADLNWDMWLDRRRSGLQPQPLGREGRQFPTFRYFWDYAGGAMTDWGVHLIDPLHQCFGEVMPNFVVALATNIT